MNFKKEKTIAGQIFMLINGKSSVKTDSIDSKIVKKKKSKNQKLIINNQEKNKKMKSILTALLIVMFTFSTAAQDESRPGNKTLPQVNDSIAYYQKMRDSLVNANMKEYEKYNKEIEGYSEPKNKKGLGSTFFGLNVDVIFGVGFAKTEFDVTKDTAGLSNANSKAGPMVGVNINFNLMGLALGTGFNYSSKGFSSGSDSYSANYFNIPLMFAFNFNISKVEIDLAAGPYVGILLSQDKNQFYAMKNIDIGIAGSVQGSYFFNRFVGALVGVKYERGGLNGLLESNGMNNYVSGIKTQNWFVYSGIKFVL
jgi:hypothetical protein